MLIKTIRLAFINMLICSNIFNTIFNTKFGSFQARHIVFNSYVSTESPHRKYIPDFDYHETKDGIMNGSTVHEFNFAQYIKDSNGYDRFVFSQDTGNLDTKTKEGLDFFVRNLNFKISYTCSNLSTNAVGKGQMDKYNISGIPAVILMKDEKQKSISIKFIVNFSRVKNMIIDSTNLINDFYKGSKKTDNTIADISVYPFLDKKIIEVYKGKLSSTNKMVCLNFTETFENKDFSNKKSAGGDYPLMGCVRITRKIDKFNFIPKTLTMPLGLLTKDLAITRFEVMLDHLINKKKSDLSYKQVRQLSWAANLVRGMRTREGFEVRLPSMTPKKIFTDINTYMNERRKELLEKFDTDVVFFTTMFLLERPHKIQIKGFSFTINGEKLTDFNIVNLYKLCMFLKGKDEIMTAFKKLILDNKGNKGLLGPSTIYQVAAFSSNGGVDKTKNQQKTESNNSKNTADSSETETDDSTPKKQSNISGVIIYVAIGVVAMGAIGGLVYSFIL